MLSIMTDISVITTSMIAVCLSDIKIPFFNRFYKLFWLLSSNHHGYITITKAKKRVGLQLFGDLAVLVIRPNISSTNMLAILVLCG